MAKEESIDNSAVDLFAVAMKNKLAIARDKGRHGWHDRKVVNQLELVEMFYASVKKGDLIDIANFCMMLHFRAHEFGATKWRVTPPETWEPHNVELTSRAVARSG